MPFEYFWVSSSSLLQSRISLDQSSHNLSLLPDAVSISLPSSVVSLSFSHFNAFVHIASMFWMLFPSCCQSSTLFSSVLGESAVFFIQCTHTASVNEKTLGLWSAPQSRGYSLSQSSVLQPSEGINNNKFPISSNFY